MRYLVAVVFAVAIGCSATERIEYPIAKSVQHKMGSFNSPDYTIVECEDGSVIAVHGIHSVVIGKRWAVCPQTWTQPRRVEVIP